MRVRGLLTIGGPAALAAALCGYQLSTRSLWLDEGATFAITSQHGAALWHGIAHDGGNMLAYYLLMHLVVGAFGAGEVALRLPSLIADALTAALTAALGLRLLRSHAAALAAGVLSAVSLPLVFWGQDARGYSLMAALATASMLAVVVLVDSDAPRPWLAALGYAVTLTLALYVGFDAVLIVPAQLLLVWWLRRERTPLLIICLVLVALTCVPLAVLAVQRGSSQLFWVPPLTWSGLWQALVTLTSAGMPPNFHSVWARGPLAILTVLAVLAALPWRRPRATPRAVRRREGPCELTPPEQANSHQPQPLIGGLAVPLLWLLVPAVLAVLAVLAGEPLELPRLAVMLMPALGLMLAGALLPAGRPAPRTAPAGSRRPVAAAVLLLVLVALRAVVLAPSYGASPEPWNAAARYLLGATRSRPACVAFYPQDGRMPFGYYVRAAGGAPGLTPVLPSEGWGVVRAHVEQYSAPSAAAAGSIADRCGRLFVVASHEGQRSGPPSSQRNYAGYRRLLARLERLYQHRSTRQFGYAAVIRVTELRR